METIFISECCGVRVNIDFVDYGICPDCKEHCEIVEEEIIKPKIK